MSHSPPIQGIMALEWLFAIIITLDNFYSIASQEDSATELTEGREFPVYQPREIPAASYKQGKEIRNPGRRAVVAVAKPEEGISQATDILILRQECPAWNIVHNQVLHGNLWCCHPEESSVLILRMR